MRAHELLEAMNKFGLNTDVRRGIYNDCMAAVKFDLGDSESVKNMVDKASFKFFEIPAPICLLQIIYPGNDPFLLLAKKTYDVKLVDQNHTIHDKAATEWKVFYKTDGSWGLGEVFVYISPQLTDHKDEVSGETYTQAPNIMVWNANKKQNVTENMNFEERETANMVLQVASAIEVFSCSNVTTVEHNPPKFINSLRTKKGKVPFFSYRTLHITGERTESDSDSEQKGTHASPRVHLRRGHIRTYANGRKVWVQPCLVGDKSKGLALHDYHVNLQPADC